MDFSRAVDQVISQHLGELQKPGVLSIRPGYQSAGGWLTKKPAIVVTVDQKRDDLSPQDRLPETLGGYPVDVRQASPLHRLRASNPALYASVAAAARPELRRPIFPLERDASGQSLAPVAQAAAAARKPSKPQLQYAPPANSPLNSVEEKMTITCHASPDAGWTMLKPFLEATASGLTVGMYDLTSAHILQTLLASLKVKRKLNLVLDHPAPNPSRDQTDDQTYADLQQALTNRLGFAWALEGNDPHAAAWLFPNAYHIKVAVRDGNTFWLSSGNWNNSNQPDIDPVKDPAGSASVARNSDRDWHVIVEHEGLAALFEKYLLNDLKVASAHQVTGAAADMAAALADLAQPALAVAARTPKRYFAPLEITDTIKVQPLLTPDNYVDFILPLLNSAKTSLYMQTQYIHPSDKPEDQKLAALIGTIAAKISAGVDVRLIMSQYETMDYLELLQKAGIDMPHVRIQTGVHNKGIVVDSQTVVVSSQNWSSDGVIRNRDAGLIIDNSEAAQYWQQIFIHDWTNMAVQQAAD